MGCAGMRGVAGCVGGHEGCGWVCGGDGDDGEGSR